MDTINYNASLKYFKAKYSLDLTRPSPIEIPNVGRDELAVWFRELGFTRGAEVGVERGIFSQVILAANPEMEHYCVDAWRSYADYRAWCNRSHLAQKYYEVKERLAAFPNVQLIKAFSMNAVNQFEDESLDYVYIDANHELPWVMDDILEWSRKVRPGGIVAGHDYIQTPRSKPSQCDVIKAVYWYTTLKPVKTWFLIGTRAKVPGEIRDKTRSFFWVKK
jgi:predicted O-methyltransferase YrrM